MKGLFIEARMRTSGLFFTLALRQIEGVTLTQKIFLLTRFKNAKAVFDAPYETLTSCVGAKTAHAVTSFDSFGEIEKEISLLEKHHLSCVCFTDTDYPALLKEIAAPPLVLFYQGTLDGLAAGDQVAIVGAREATAYGRQVAFEMALALAARGVGIVSGFARGIDIEAHRGALDGGGRTYALLGGGHGRLYPREHRPIIEKICEKGAVISEYSYETYPLKPYFPQRNRLIAGLSRGVVVVEAREVSGSLITAQFALDQNRQVYAVPGPVTAPTSRGCHRLINEGAKLAQDAETILADLKYPTLPITRIPFENADYETIYSLLKEGYATSDALTSQSCLPTLRVSQVLTDLELQGRIRRIPGGKFAGL